MPTKISAMLDFPVLARYSRKHLRAIAMPIGGIGTGSLCLAGEGALTDWQLMNRPHRGWRPPYAHLLMWGRTVRGKAFLRVLEGTLRWNLDADHGAPDTLAGIPHMRAEGFDAAYPYGRVVLRDPTLPIRVSLTGFNPLIPGATEDSSLPFALLEITLQNLTSNPMDASVSFLLTNFLGSDGVQTDLRGNISEFAEVEGWQGLLFRKEPAQRDPRWGTMALLAEGGTITSARRWAFRDRPWNGEQLGILDTLLQQGILPDEDPTTPCSPSDERGWDSSVSIRFTLSPHGSHSVRFLLCWHFPYRNLREMGWWQGKPDADSIVRNYYATRFGDALEVAQHVVPRLDELHQRTLAFVRQVLEADKPAVFKESALNCLAVLKSQTVFRLEDGTFYGFEGCNATNGCCHGSCTHVWNYEQATLVLFPDLHRSMLESHLTYGLTEDGAHRFRLDLPVGDPVWNLSAVDGQMGMVVRVYQQYQKDGDLNWLQKMYPKVKRMLEFAWRPGGWDADQDGVMEGIQHNTYDVEFVGPNPMCQSWYMAGLRAGEQIARLVGDAPFAQKCRQLFEQGSAWTDQRLFNGEYYIQQVRPPTEQPHPNVTAWRPYPVPPPFQMGEGCLIDQLIGQYKANRAGLGDLFQQEHIVRALRSLYHYNFRKHFHHHYNNMRTYATADESGVVLCTFPKGSRPDQPFPYWTECWTGLEYAFARLLLDYGFPQEAEEVVQAVRQRHDGAKRNPFNEPECGSHYARCMSAWSLVMGERAE